MAQIQPEGIRNEYWRGKLAENPAGHPQFARLYLTRALAADPRCARVLQLLLAGPEQDSEDVDPWGDRSFRKVTLEGQDYFLKIDCYSSEGDMEFGSDDPGDDSKTVRIFTAMQASDY